MLIATKCAFMQQIQKAASAGYIFYTSGSVKPHKLMVLIKKFKKNYSVNQPRQKAYRERTKGKASAKFYAYIHPEDDNAFFWVLLLTEGEHGAKQSESLSNLLIKKQRIEYSYFQLIQNPSNTDKPSFTWSLKTEALLSFKDKLRKAVRKKQLRNIRKVMDDIGWLPGFSGIRKQKKEIQKLFKYEAKRYFRSLSDDKIKNLYLRQIKIKQIKYIDSFVRKAEENQRTVKEQIRISLFNKRE